MKRMAWIITAVLLPLAVFAVDANLLKYVEILPAQAPTFEKTDVLLLGPVGLTNGVSSTGTAVNVSTYEGYGIVVAGQGARSASGDTSTVVIAYGYSNTTATNALLTATQTSATAKYTSYEFDFDTVQGTNAALWLQATFNNVEGDTTPMIGSALLVYDAARASTTNTGSAVDVSAYKGNATFVFECGSPINESSTFTNVVTVQHSTTGSTGWSTVTNLAGTALVVTDTGATGQTATIPCDLSRLHKYIRAISVQTGDVAPVGVTLVAPMKSE